MMRKLAKEIHQNAIDKGFWLERDDYDNNIPEKLALIHSEISEALEEYRTQENLSRIYQKGKSLKPEGFGIELADAVIRILDLAEYLNINMEECIEMKMFYNKTRDFRHGNKRC